MAAGLQHDELCAGNAPDHALGELERIDPILIAGDDEGRHLELFERRFAIPGLIARVGAG